MHIHTTQGFAIGNALASAHAAETAASLRRARELRDAASKLRAVSTDLNPDQKFTAIHGSDAGGSKLQSPVAESPDLKPASSPVPISIWA